MRHPSEGVLRRLLDEPAGVADPDRQHVKDCTPCLGDLAEMRAAAALVGAAFSTHEAAGVDVAAGWQRLSAATTATAPAQPRASAARPRSNRVAGLLKRPAAAVLAVTVVLAGAGTAAAGGWLQIFRTEQVAAVSITTEDLVALPDLSSYGDLEVTEEAALGSVPDAEVAGDRTGLDVPEVTELPAGISGGPIYQTIGKVSATFTFSAERAARAAADTGEALPPPPAGLEGSSVRLDAGPGVAQIWTSSSGAPALVVGRAVAPTAFSSGPPFEALRDYLLSLPGLPDDVAAQLRTFTADGSTLPLPLPADEVSTSSAEIDGVPATVVTTRDGTLAAVVWVDDGTLTAVAGSLDTDEVLTVARGLR